MATRREGRQAARRCFLAPLLRTAKHRPFCKSTSVHAGGWKTGPDGGGSARLLPFLPFLLVAFALPKSQHRKK